MLVQGGWHVSMWFMAPTIVDLLYMDKGHSDVTLSETDSRGPGSDNWSSSTKWCHHFIHCPMQANTGYTRQVYLVRRRLVSIYVHVPSSGWQSSDHAVKIFCELDLASQTRPGWDRKSKVSKMMD